MIPHLKYPLTVGAKVATVDQDSPQEVAQCVYAVLATRPGDRAEHPAFGTPDFLFRQGGVDFDEIRRAIDEFEPRASDAVIEGELENMAQTVRVQL